MAHGIYLTDEELVLVKNKGVGIAHCPVSNFNLHSGVLDAQRVLAHGIKLGLGTDCSGGHSSSIFESIRQGVTASVTNEFIQNNYTPLNYKELFALATIGGSQVLGIEDKVGNFVVGKEFDAIQVDPYVKDSPFDVFQTDSLEDIVQKFFFLGDNRNIINVFVKGNKLEI